MKSRVALALDLHGCRKCNWIVGTTAWMQEVERLRRQSRTILAHVLATLVHPWKNKRGRSD